MQGLSLKLPVTYDVKHGGYSLHTNFKELVQQNFKHLVLTCPGERMMLPEFGVGLRNFLFFQEGEIRQKLNSKIREQVKNYLPYVTIRKIDLNTSKDTFLNNFLSIKIFYRIDAVGADAVLTAQVNDNSSELIL
jgi:phage baseplate assembly protein W